MTHLDTGTRTRVRPHLLLPDRSGWVDLLMTVVLGLVVLSGWASSFTGWSFLAVGATGLVLGVLVTHVVRALGWPLVTAALVLVVLFFLLAGPLCLRALGDARVLPGTGTFEEAADQAVFGWKDFLTTLPPVDGDGPLLVLPWLLGLATGALVTAVSQARVRDPWLSAVLPVACMATALAVVILLGVRHPQSLVLQGSVFAGLALAWVALRARRASAAVRGGRAGWARVVVGAAMLALAAGLALPASALISSEDRDRVVARTWVEPPFDIGLYPSPLAGFRKYVDPKGQRNDANVHDDPLFTITGVEAGTRVRLATMDRYDGMVWGATNDPLPGEDGDAYQRVSSTIDNPVDGRPVEASVTIEEGYDGVWLPTVGALTSLDFRIGDPLGKAEVFRYNLATSTGVVPSGLQPGDTYTFTAVEPVDSLDDSTVAASGQTYVPAPGTEFVQGPAEKWTRRATDPMARVLAAAEHLRTQGRYSDGIGRTQRAFHAGHSLRRLGDEFVNAPQMVGNDEQYAAVMALVANEIGVPARVVLGAVVPEGGQVKGEHVAAWVELRAADGSWRTLATEEFMSRRPPAEQVPETETPMTGTVVPPPNPVPPPSDTGEQTDADLKERKAKRKSAEEEDEATPLGLPSWAVRAAVYVGGPLLLLVLLLASVVGLKALRRRRRRRAPRVSSRFVGGWREVVDHARDLGQPVPLGPTTTRREQSLLLSTGGAGALARRADSHVFGPAVPEPSAAASFWEAVDAERRAMSRAVGRRRRFLAAVNLTTLLPGSARLPWRRRR